MLPQVLLQRGGRGRLAAPGHRHDLRLLATIPTSILASAAAIAQSPDTQEEITEVVITGTSLRTEAPVGSDITVLGREEILEFGAPNTAELLRKVPNLDTFNGVTRTRLVASTGVASPPGLRNLHPSATLVLMNGHRLSAENPLSTWPDPSSIPPAAIERVEIVADGASAIYGSDAVAGVINIILRSDLDGAETSLRKSWAQHGYDAVDFSQALGKVWSSGSGMIVVGYNKNDNILNSELPYYTEDLRPWGGIDLRPTNCPDPNVIMDGVTYAPPDYAAGPAARCTPGLMSDAVTEFKRLAIVGTLRQDINENFSLFGDFRHTNTDARHNSAPGGTNVTLTTDNPFFFRPPGATGDSQTVVMNLFPIVGRLANVAEAKSTDVMVGAEYMMPRDFRLQATVHYGKGENDAHQPGFDAAALAAAAAGTTPETALDPFQGRTNPAVAAEIANFENYFASEQKLYNYTLKVDGPLFSMPGGDLKVAVGLDYRKQTYDAINPVGKIGEIQNAGIVSAERSVKAAFGEVLVPIFGAGNAVPGFQKLNLSAAVRHDDYNDFGSTTNPKFGLTWVPVEGLTIRGSYGNSFHAPDMGDSYAVDTRAIYAVNFALVPPGTPPVDSIALAGGNPGLKPEEATTYSFGVDITPPALDGLRLSLTYWNIKYEQLVRAPPLSPEIFTNPAFQSFVVFNPTQEQIDEIAANFRVVNTTLPIPPGVMQIVDLRRHNLGATDTDGIDFAVSYRWDTSIGGFAAGVSGSRAMSFDLQAGPGAPFVPQENFVKTRWRADVSYLNGPFSAGIGWNHSGEFRQTYALLAGGTGVQTVDPFDTVDLRAAYELPDQGWFSGTTLSLNVDNALDEDPPLLLAGGGYSSFASPIGRQVWVGLQKKF